MSNLDTQRQRTPRSFAVAHSRAHAGIETVPVTIETHISSGLPKFNIVGLPETIIKESKERVRCAIINSHFEFPYQHITVNLGPANLPKEGSAFDLPIALSILAASGQLPADGLKDYEFAGELALSGELRAIHGALPIALAARKAQHGLFVPKANTEEASLADGLQLFAANHLIEVFNHLKQLSLLTPEPTRQISELINQQKQAEIALDLADVDGQAFAKRALEIAAAGRHSLLMSGPPGTGKSMLSMRLSSLLPTMSESELLEMAAIYSFSQKKLPPLETLATRPFRSPHHTASSAALVGGGNPPSPGEISHAHHGVLFLDELPEFKRSVLEALREPIETGQITISRAMHQVTFPARFQLIAAMNPCPCGYQGDRFRECQCSPKQIANYQARLSGPFLDRIDLCITVNQANSYQTKGTTPETSTAIKQRVVNARKKQLQRQANISNADLTAPQVKTYCILDQKGLAILSEATEKMGLSSRAQHRLLKVARTTADLAEAETISAQHLQEALAYRLFSAR